VNLRQLEVFCTVVECESFSAAAEQLIMTQPAVSMQVQAVETHFGGVKLLERRNRRTVPTEAGRIVHLWAREVLRSHDETKKALDELTHAEAGRIVIGSSMTIGSHVLPPILSRFKRQHPSAEIVVRLGEKHEVCAEIANGGVDCGVVIAREIPGDLAVEVVGFEEIMFIAGPAHPLAGRHQLQVEDVAVQPFILAPKGSSYRKVIDDMLDQQGLSNVPVLMELDGADSVKRAVQQGLGLGVALRSSVEWELAQGLLHELQLAGPRPQVPIGIVSDPRRHGSSIAQEFVDYLHDQLREQLTPRQDTCEEEQCEQRPGAAAGRVAGRLAHHR
jgi:DNA-binding transcriptional LysR family regulator